MADRSELQPTWATRIEWDEQFLHAHRAENIRGCLVI